jgi:putative ABC transport system permease protein
MGMIGFLLKGLLRDRSRSLFPILITASGVALTILAIAWISGILNDTIETAARFKNGHLKLQTRALLEDRYPNVIELGLIDVEALKQQLSRDYPGLIWKPRIQFGGLLDVPDENGETLYQAPVAGIAADLLTDGSPEPAHLNLAGALIQGRLPLTEAEVLISEDLFQKLALRLGQTVTLISSDMQGSMSLHNFEIAGTLTFGVKALDRGALVADLTGVRYALAMEDAATEILGFFTEGYYDGPAAAAIKADFMKRHGAGTSDFDPVMVTIEDQDRLGEIFEFMNAIWSAIIAIFVLIVSIVLWNAGLMSGIRRYGEIGVRLAIGESKCHLYLSLVLEAVVIGLAAYLLGTVLGLIPAWYLQTYGVDFGYLMEGASLMMSNVMRAEITPISFWIGLIPGLLAPVIGAAMSGLAVLRRDTSRLFKELET